MVIDQPPNTHRSNRIPAHPPFSCSSVFVIPSLRALRLRESSLPSPSHPLRLRALACVSAELQWSPKPPHSHVRASVATVRGGMVFVTSGLQTAWKAAAGCGRIQASDPPRALCSEYRGERRETEPGGRRGLVDEAFERTAKAVRAASSHESADGISTIVPLQKEAGPRRAMRMDLNWEPQSAANDKENDLAESA